MPQRKHCVKRCPLSKGNAAGWLGTIREFFELHLCRSTGRYR